MVDEDYIDDGGFPDDTFDAPSHRSQHLHGNKRNFRGALIWRTGEGIEVPIDEMEEDHLKNTINYIQRRRDEWARASAVAKDRSGVDLGDFKVNGRPAEEWFDILTREVARREYLRNNLDN